MDETIIRQYHTNDRPFIRDIAWKTAFMGEPADVFFADKNIFADFLTAYFTDYEPGSCLVAQNQGEVVGYLIGCKNTENLHKTFLVKIFPLLLVKLFLRGTLLRRKNIIFLWYCGLSFLKNEFKMPPLPDRYRATFHINIKTDFQGKGLGSQMILRYLGYLKKQNVGRVYLSTMSQGASRFFKNQGFSLFHQSRRSYFQYLLGRDIDVYTFIKKI